MTKVTLFAFALITLLSITSANPIDKNEFKMLQLCIDSAAKGWPQAVYDDSDMEDLCDSLYKKVSEDFDIGKRGLLMNSKVMPKQKGIFSNMKQRY